MKMGRRSWTRISTLTMPLLVAPVFVGCNAERRRTIRLDGQTE